MLQEPEQVVSPQSLMKTMVKEAATAVQGGLCWSRPSFCGRCYTGTDRCALKEAADHGKLMWFCRYRSLRRTCAKPVCFWWTVKKAHTGDVLDGLNPMGGTLKCSRKRVWEGWAAVTKINFYELATNRIPHPPATFGRKEVEDTGVTFSLGRRQWGGNMFLVLSFASHQSNLVLIGNKLDQSPHSLLFSLTHNLLYLIFSSVQLRKRRNNGVGNWQPVKVSPLHTLLWFCI